ncbi:hypothetical protein [Desulfuromonas sp.]|uniref:hypothetical protein n=1 Tax=Desulfuromonas sp. TaxID=892 RepID=UPI0025BD29A6|nr:hypothetical protein [Desulfuromonas sp.]
MAEAAAEQQKTTKLDPGRKAQRLGKNTSGFLGWGAIHCREVDLLMRRLVEGPVEAAGSLQELEGALELFDGGRAEVDALFRLRRKVVPG